MSFNSRRGWISIACVLGIICMPLASQGVDARERLAAATSHSKRAFAIEDQIGLKLILKSEVSPDKTQILLHIVQADPSSNSYRSGWFVAEAKPGAELHYVTDAGQPYRNRSSTGRLMSDLLSWPAVWSPDGKWVAFVKRDEDGAQIWKVSSVGGVPEQITHNRSDVLELAWRTDARAIYYAVGRPRDVEVGGAESLRGYLADERIELGYPTELMWQSCVEADVRARLLSHLEGGDACSPTVWRADLTTKLEEIATEAEVVEFKASKVDSAFDRVFGQIRGRTSSPDRGWQAWLANADPEAFKSQNPPMAIYASRNGASPIRCSFAECEGWVTPPLWLDDQRIIFRQSSGRMLSTMSVYVWRPGTGRPRKIWSGESRLTSCSVSAGHMICLQEDLTQPAQLVALDPDDGSIEVVYDPNPQLAAIRFPRIEKLEWDTEEGLEAVSYFVYPADYKAGTRYPLVVVTYSCGGFLRDTGDEHAIYAMAAQGLAVLCYSLPMADTRKIADRKQANIVLWESMRPRAMHTAIDRLVARGIVDPARIGVSGISTGSTIVAEAMLDESRRFAAASAASTPHGASYFMFSQGRELAREAGLGDPFGPAFEAHKRRSPAMNPEKVVTPLLLHMADSELALSAAGYVGLKDAGKPVEMYVFRDEGHIKWHPAHKYNVYKRNLQWFLFWLQNRELTDPVDPDQYSRWRELRRLQCSDPAGIRTFCNKAPSL